MVNHCVPFAYYALAALDIGDGFMLMEET